MFRTIHNIRSRFNNWFGALPSEQALSVVLRSASVTVLTIASVIGLIAGSWLVFGLVIFIVFMSVMALVLCVGAAESANTIHR